MIKYKMNPVDILTKKGISTYRIRKDRLFAESALQDMRRNHVTIPTLDKLCYLLKCDVSDLIEYVSSDTETR